MHGMHKVCYVIATIHNYNRIHSGQLYMHFSVAILLLFFLISLLFTGMGVTAVSLKGPYPAELLAKTRRKHAKSPAGIAIMLVVTGTVKRTC